MARETEGADVQAVKEMAEQVLKEEANEREFGLPKSQKGVIF